MSFFTEKFVRYEGDDLFYFLADNNIEKQVSFLEWFGSDLIETSGQRVIDFKYKEGNNDQAKTER